MQNTVAAATSSVDFMQYPWLVWGFIVLIIFMLVLDLWVFNKKSHEISNKEALGFSALWISLAMWFSGIVWWLMWSEKFAEFQWAYWIEKALSVDNLFVFILVFGFFKVPKKYQHKILFYWIIWAILFRAIFIFAWVWLINSTNFSINLLWEIRQFNPILFTFWLFLLYSWIKSWKWDDENEEPKDVTKSFWYKIVQKFFKIKPTIESSKFFTVENWVRYATPLFVTLVIIEITDLVFAIDSIPAIFSISNDAFILYTSNIFAILGLRSLYFLLANSMNLFSKLHYGLAVILAFIWTKMIIMPFYHFDVRVSLAIIATVLIWTIVWSLMANKKEAEQK